MIHRMEDFWSEETLKPLLFSKANLWSFALGNVNTTSISLDYRMWESFPDSENIYRTRLKFSEWLKILRNVTPLMMVLMIRGTLTGIFRWSLQKTKIDFKE